MNSASSPRIFAWKPSAWIAVHGTDAAGFLQGQFTNDLRGAMGAVYGLWLNVKGKVLADSFVMAAQDGSYRICSYASPAGIIRERLESHVIADDVELTDETATVSALTLIGPEAAVAGRELAAAIGGYCFAGRRCREDHVELVFATELNALVAERTRSLATVSPVEMERRRIASGIPSVPRDIGPNDLPNEGGLENDAVSYTKGCYLGQEVMARLKNLGQVRRKLLAVTGDVPLPPSLPAALYASGRTVGELRSAVVVDGTLHGLALVTLLHITPSTKLAFSADGNAGLSMENHS